MLCCGVLCCVHPLPHADSLWLMGGCCMVQGVFNFTNPGAISHNQILDLYKKVRAMGSTPACAWWCTLTACVSVALQHIDPDFWYENFSEEDQAKVLKAGRSNNELVRRSTLFVLPAVFRAVQSSRHQRHLAVVCCCLLLFAVVCCCLLLFAVVCCCC